MTMATRGFGRGRVRKQPVATTMARPPSNVNFEPVDVSQIRKSIDTSVSSLKQVLNLFDTATDEVKRYITYECDIIYECRTCYALFRSLANFILHKRTHCRKIYEPARNNRNDDDIESNSVEITSNVVSSEDDKTKKPGKNLSEVLKKLSENQKMMKVSEEISRVELSGESRQEEVVKKNRICLEKIKTSSVGVFQTVPTVNKSDEEEDSIASEVLEIHSISNNNEAVLQPDGKSFLFDSEPNRSNPINKKLTCSVCKLSFSTKKTLRHHIKYKHSDTRLVYSCPECRNVFANAWSVFRHLYKVHRKTTVQIRKLRHLIHTTPIIWKQIPGVQKENRLIEDGNSVHRENQWLNNLEGDCDLQMCGGCGKRFERKAALHSHSQICTKRIAVCNSIKKNLIDEKSTKYKLRNNPTIKGSKKRKPGISRKFIRDNIKETQPTQQDTTEKIVDKTENDEKQEDEFEPIIILYSDEESENENQINENENQINEIENQINENENQINENEEQFVELNEEENDDEEILIDNENVDLNKNPLLSPETDKSRESVELDVTTNGIFEEPSEIVDLTEDASDSGENELEADGNPSLTPPPKRLKGNETQLQKMIMEVIFGPEAVPSAGVGNEKRSRNSVKALDKDFVYDMNIVDNQIKSRTNRSKVKPVK